MSTHNIPFSIKKSPLIFPNLQPLDFFQGTQERVQNSHGKRVLSVQAIKVSVYLETKLNTTYEYFVSACTHTYTYKHRQIWTHMMGILFISTSLLCKWTINNCCSRVTSLNEDQALCLLGQAQSKKGV